MAKHRCKNERIKRKYLTYLKEAQRNSETSIDNAAAAIARFEKYTNHKDFKRFHIQQAIGFKKQLASQKNEKTSSTLSLATQRATLNILRSFFIWLADQPGYRSCLNYTSADYFRLSEKDNRAAQSHTERHRLSLEQAQRVIQAMPAETVIEQRDRALVAFTLMTGCRDRALVSLKLKHIDLANKRVTLDAREVMTKNSKSFSTFFMPVGEDIYAIFEGWITSLTYDHNWLSTDPLFPNTLMGHDKHDGFKAIGIKREHWTSTNAVRRIFRSACENAAMPYVHPHSFRHTLVQLGQQICRTPEEFKAWSQNLGHDHVMTTFKSYGTVSAPRQAEIISQVGKPSPPDSGNMVELLRELAETLEAQRMK